MRLVAHIFSSGVILAFPPPPLPYTFRINLSRSMKLAVGIFIFSFIKLVDLSFATGVQWGLLMG